MLSNILRALACVIYLVTITGVSFAGFSYAQGAYGVAIACFMLLAAHDQQ